MGFGGSGGSGSSVAGSSDVALNSPINHEVLTYDSSVSKWKNAIGVTQDSLDLKAPLESPAFTGTPTGITKSHIGLENVDDTADTAKPISTATQTALDGKAGINDARFSDMRTPVDTTVTTSKIVDGAVTSVKLSSAVQASLGRADSALQAAPITSVAGKTGVVTLVKGDVGLGSVDNIADSAKPVSAATQTALNGKANTAHAHDAADVTTGVINVTRLPASTDTTVGVVELATIAETTTGTDTIRAVTPLGVKAAITAAIPTVLFVDALADIPPGTPVDTLVVVRIV